MEFSLCRSNETGLEESAALWPKRKSELNLEVWQEFDGQKHPDFFKSVEIASDGGFSEVGDLWYPTRWLTAAMVIISITSNVYFIVMVDVRILKGHILSKESNFLMSQAIYRRMYMLVLQCGAMPTDKSCGPATSTSGTWSMDGEGLIAVLELLGLVILLTNTFLCVLRALGSGSERVHWNAVEKLFWVILPELSSYSAMRLLHFVTPAVLLSELGHEMILAVGLWKGQKLEVLKVVLKFTIVRCFCFVVGYDAFIVKCRAAYFYINAEELSPRVLFGSLNFLIQVVGVVQLGMFVKNRLFMFVFAGEDSALQPREVALQRVWNAMLAREIWRQHRFSRFLLIMLTFNDTDFQRLVLNDSSSLSGHRRDDAQLSVAHLVSSRTLGAEDTSAFSFAA